MRKVLSIIMAVVMVLGMVPFTVLSAFATESGAQSVTNGNYSLSIDKAEFQKGEPIYVTATGGSNVDWIGIGKAGTNSYLDYYYLGQSGSGTPYNILRVLDLTPGEYELFLVPNNGKNYSFATVKELFFTVNDEEFSGSDKVPLADIGDTSLLTTKNGQKTFAKGEPIYIAATGESGDWIGIYKDVYDEVYSSYTYISNMGGSGNYYNINQAGNMAPGTYFIRLMPSNAANTPYSVWAKAGIYVTIVDEVYVEPDEEEKLDPETGLPCDFGINPSRLTIEKKIFKKGEPILVSAISTHDKDWVGIYDDGVNTKSLKYHYVPSDKSGVFIDVAEGLDLPAGDYLIRLIPADQNLAGNEANTISGVWIIITDEDYTDPENPGQGGTTDPEDPEQGGTDNPDTNDGVTVKNDTHSLSVNKTKFEVGESILVTAEGIDSKDWIGIAERGYTDGTIRWYYIAGVGNGVPFDIRTAENIGGNLSALKDIPQGLYTIYLVENDEYLKNGYTFSINISVGNIEDADNGKTDGGTVEGDTPVYGVVPPLGAVYVPSVNGYAGGTVTVTMPTEALNSHDIVMYWANENGLLAGYTAHARFKVTGIESSYTFGKSVIIPSGATKLFIYSQRSASGEMSSEFVTVDLPKDSQMSITGNKLHSFYAISDVHIGSANGAKHFELMLNDAISLNPNGVAIFISGDITDKGIESQYEELFAIYNEVMRKTGANGADYPMFFAIGNHDYPSAAGAFLSYATLPDGSHPKDTSYDFWFNGYHYIMLGSDNPSGLYSSFSAETLAWLDSVLAENRNASRPTFIFLHQPMYNTVSGSLPGEGWHGVSNEDALRAVLQKYPEIIMFNGHTHWEMNSKGNMFEATEELPINIFNCASVSYLWSGYNKLTGEDLYGSQGYYVEVYGDRVVVRGRDFVNGLWLPSAQYCIETGVECEHNLETQSIEYKNGYLQAGVRTEKCKLCSAIVTTKLDAMITFSGYSVKEIGAPAICVGYTVNFDALTLYESVMGTEIEIGITAASYDNLTVEGKPINADGTTCETTGGVVVNYKVEGNYNHINLILNSGNWDEYADKRVILCAYYVEKGEVYYLCDREVATQSAGYITYNELKN